LALSLMSGEERLCTPTCLCFCRSWLASEGGRPVDPISRMYHCVGAAEGCDLLIVFVSTIKPTDRSLVALDSSYGEMRTHDEPGRPVDLIAHGKKTAPPTRGRGFP
jgi:hypothetical protein